MRGIRFAVVVVICLVVDLLSSSTATATTPPSVFLSDTGLAPGGTSELYASAFAANSSLDVTISMGTTTLQVSTVSTDVTGSVAAPVAIPLDVQPGAWTLTVQQASDPSMVATASLTVRAPYMGMDQPNVFQPILPLPGAGILIRFLYTNGSAMTQFAIDGQSVTPTGTALGSGGMTDYVVTLPLSLPPGPHTMSAQESTAPLAAASFTFTTPAPTLTTGLVDAGSNTVAVTGSDFGYTDTVDVGYITGGVRHVLVPATTGSDGSLQTAVPYRALPTGGMLQLYVTSRSSGWTTTTTLDLTTASEAPPRGNLETFTMLPSGYVRIAGWAFDPAYPATSTGIEVGVGAGAYGASANLSRLDVASAFSLPDPQHGFSLTVPVPVGGAMVCVYAVSASQATATTLGCAFQMPPPAHIADNIEQIFQPTFRVDDSGYHATVHISGWMFDTASPATSIRFQVNVGQAVYSGLADGSRPDVQSALGAPSAQVGFAIDVPVPMTGSRACLYAFSAAMTAWTEVTCWYAYPGGFLPPLRGNLDSVHVANGSVSLSGWAQNQQEYVSSAIRIQVNVGASYTSVYRSINRPDVAQIFPALYPPPEPSGFAATVPIPVTPTPMCVYAVDDYMSKTVTLGCQMV